MNNIDFDKIKKEYEFLVSENVRLRQENDKLLKHNITFKLGYESLQKTLNRLNFQVLDNKNGNADYLENFRIPKNVNSDKT